MDVPGGVDRTNAVLWDEGVFSYGVLNNLLWIYGDIIISSYNWCGIVVNWWNLSLR